MWMTWAGTRVTRIRERWTVAYGGEWSPPSSRYHVSGLSWNTKFVHQGYREIATQGRHQVKGKVLVIEVDMTPSESARGFELHDVYKSSK